MNFELLPLEKAPKPKRRGHVLRNERYREIMERAQELCETSALLMVTASELIAECEGNKIRLDRKC